VSLSNGEKITAADIRDRLRSYYGAAEWALLFEVLDATGARNTRSADALAMNTWPSRGLAVHGIEIKVSRSDFLNELRRPAKAETIARYCDYWWVAAPEDIVKPGEVPEAWGHLAPFGDSLGVVKLGAKNPEPKALDRLFVASVLRNAGRVDEGELRIAAAKILAAERAAIQETVDNEVSRRSTRWKELSDIVNKFESDSGLAIATGWRGEKLGKKVKILETVMDWGGVSTLSKQLRKKADEIDAALADAGIPHD
jgi:hypothetical protein